MEIKQKKIETNSLKFFIIDQTTNKEIARVFLYLLHNDLHKEPFGFIEDLYVEETHRGQGLGSTLINHVIAQAKANNCYKLICTSRHSRDKIHQMYEKHGFKNYGLEFRMDFSKE